MEKRINMSHVNIENMGGRDQSRMKIKFKKFEKVKSVPKDVPKCHIDDNHSRYPLGAGEEEEEPAQEC